MPPLGSPFLTFEEIRTIALWIDLGCLVDLSPGASTVSDPFDDQMKPTLAIGGIATDYNELPLPPMTVSAYDVHSDLDAESLLVVVRLADGTLTGNLAAGIQLQQGAVYGFDLQSRLASFPDETHTVFVSVADAVGNIARRRIEVTPRSLTFSQTPWAGGTVVGLSVSGAQTGDTVFFLGSLQGRGVGPVLLPSLQLDLLSPFFVLGGRVTGASGIANLSFPLPVLPVLAQLGIAVHTQAIAIRGPGGRDSVKSRPLWSAIR